MEPDDLVLLSPSRRGLQDMLSLCDTYGEEYHMNFNATKTVCMYMSNHTNVGNITPLRLSGQDLTWVDSVSWYICNT